MFDELLAFLNSLWLSLLGWYSSLGFNGHVVLQMAFLMGISVVLIFPARRLIRSLRKRLEKSPW
jgi:hypothetical protein